MKQALNTIGEDWMAHLGEAMKRPSFLMLESYLEQRKSLGAVIYPPEEDRFAALAKTPFDHVSVVLLGQDPYHGDGQAHGLSFSVKTGVRLPPSLKNIYKEIERTYQRKMPPSGDLTGWAAQGVLLLNATLSVEDGNAGSHQKKGWEEFTDSIIQKINDHKNNVVFLLWGAYAQKKMDLIDQTRHFVLTAPHPSPLSAHRGFLGCGHFQKTNAYLSAHEKNPIDWFKVGI